VKTTKVMRELGRQIATRKGDWDFVDTLDDIDELEAALEAERARYSDYEIHAQEYIKRQAELLERVRNCHHYNGMGDWGWDLHGLDIILKDLAALGETTSSTEST